MSNRELSAYLDIQYIIIMRIKKCYGFMIHGSYTNLFIFIFMQMKNLVILISRGFDSIK